MEKKKPTLQGDKPTRARKQTTHSSFETKRFMPRRELRAFLSELRRISREYLVEHPTAVAVGFFGSKFKGYDAPDSDLDAYLFYDHTKGEETGEELIDHYTQKVTSVFPGQKTHLAAKDIHRDILKEKITLAAKGERDALLLSLLFLPCVGDITPYRREVIRQIAELGEPRARHTWDRITLLLWDFENSPFPDFDALRRTDLYPDFEKIQKRYL